MSHVEKLDLRFLQNKTETFLVSVTHLILRFTIVQNKFPQTNKTKINNINDSHIKFEVSLHFLRIWPTVRHGKFEPGKVQYSTQNFFDQLFLITQNLGKDQTSPALPAVAALKKAFKLNFIMFLFFNTLIEKEALDILKDSFVTPLDSRNSNELSY